MRGISKFTLLSLAEFGHLSLQPSTSGSAEPAAMAMEVVAMAADPSEDPLPPFWSPLSSRMMPSMWMMIKVHLLW